MGMLRAARDACTMQPSNELPPHAQRHGARRRHAPTPSKRDAAVRVSHDARIGGGANKGDFVGYMDAMRLPHPKHIDIALPANMVSGKPEDGSQPTEPTWAPVTLTFAGVMEVEPAWVAEHLSQVYLLDVREPEECIPGETTLADGGIPLGQLRDRLTEIPRDKPVLAICRSGRRSAMAAGILRNAGFEQIASVAGGILRWKDEGLALKT